MGWCSGTEIFDKVTAVILECDLPEEQKEEIITVLIDALQDHDWDCESDSNYYEHPLVRGVFKEMYPHWFEEYEE